VSAKIDSMHSFLCVLTAGPYLTAFDALLGAQSISRS
jgi:hypothetical protein